MRSTLLLTILASPLTTVALSAQTDAATPLPIGTAYRTSLALGDVTGDGRVDLVIGRNGPFVLRRGTGEPQAPFGREEPLDASVEPSCDSACPPQLADLDGDGDLDLAATDTPLGSDGHFAWFANDGRGRFGPKQRLGDANGAPLVCAWRTKAMALGDWDGDGRVDLFVVDDEGRVQVHRASANGFEASVPLAVRSDGPLGFVDWSGDGRADLVLRQGPAVVVHERAADGSFGEPRAIATVADDAVSVQFAVATLGDEHRPTLLLVETRCETPGMDQVMKETTAVLRETIAEARRRLAAMRPADGDAAALARWQKHQEALARWLEEPAALHDALVLAAAEGGPRLRLVRRE
jgi:hypothetical protein